MLVKWPLGEKMEKGAGKRGKKLKMSLLGYKFWFNRPPGLGSLRGILKVGEGDGRNAQ